MALSENLRRIHSPKIFGSHFNERPKPDVLGRTPATPLEIQKAMKGEFNQPFQESTSYQDQAATKYELLKKAREERKKDARISHDARKRHKA